MYKMNEEVNRNKVNRNIEKDEEDTRRMITRTVRFSMNEETALRKTIKTCSTTAFEGVKEIIENTVSKSNKVEYWRNEDQEGRIYSESIRVKENESRRNQVIYTVNIYRPKSSLLINGPQTQKFLLEVIPIIQLWTLEYKTTINISNEKLKKVLGKLKVERQQSKIEGQGVKDELDDHDNTKAFDFVIKRQNRKVKLGIEEHKNGESKESAREENEKEEAKGSCGFKRAEEENQTEASESNNKSWSSNPQNRKETNPQDNKEVTSSAGPIMNYQEGYNMSAEEHKISSFEKTDNLIMIYNETTTEAYIEKEERIRPQNFNNHNIDTPDICLDKPKHKVQRKDQGK